MRYIENYELREWVKDSLKKTIFQKAHALAIQTGCNILVKLQDASAPTTNQYYATGPLHKAYNNHQFRKQPGEKCVSGETGLPLMDQAVQMDASATEDRTGEMPQLSAVEDTGAMPQLGAEVDTSEMPQIGDLLTEQSFVDDKSESTMIQVSQATAVPMHLSAATESTHLDTSSTTTTVTQTPQFEQEPNGATTDNMNIKVEPSDVIEVDTGQDMEPKIEETESDFLMSQQHGSIQMFTQPPPTQRSVSHYQVPISPKPYQCGVCHKAFRSVQVLQKHTQTFHSRPQKLMSPKRGRGRGSHYLNRPLHHAPPRTSTFPTFSPGASVDTIQQTPPKSVFQEVQDLPGTSSQQIVQMSQIPSFTQPQSPSTSMFQPTPGSSTSTPAQLGSTGRERKKKNISHKAGRNMGLGIIKGILLSKGPITSFEALRKTVVYVNKDEYVDTAKKLAELGLGDFKSISTGAGGFSCSVLFIKKTPEEVKSVLEGKHMSGLTCEFCTFEEFEERYHMATPRYYIRKGTRYKLVELGLLTKEQMSLP